MSSNRCGSVCEANGYKTKIHTDEASYVWTIENFDFLEAKGERLYSPLFSSITNTQVQWYLLLYPNCSHPDGTNNLMKVSLHMSSRQYSFDKTKKIFAKMAFSILNENCKEERKQTTSIKEFSYNGPENTIRGFGKCIKKDANFRKKLLLNNTLRIRCEVMFSDAKDIIGSSHQCEFHLDVPECNFSENFVSLLENQELTDVIISANGKDYPAHKAVLAARSPVFRAMFKYSTRENMLNRVDIEDINEIVVGEMLKYIYTGKCSNLKKLAAELLAAADKYDLYQLKMICARTLLEGLSVENAAKVLVLADMHCVKELKNKVIKFIVSKPTEVLSTEGWKRIRSHFELADEVCLAIAQR
ncbi:speckle-type POZ protein B-like isoform X9 [Planococcus citri]|uniref:speckle-type POZ protein B-like isoform X9 n=1 Tax=Planococcus citri TaxID=170843 RepID=UPI0031F77A6F